MFSLSAWCMGAVYLHSKLVEDFDSRPAAAVKSASVQTPTSATIRRQRRTETKKMMPSRADPWHGWQPPVSSNIAPGACPVKRCLEGSGKFESHRDCGSCQDDPEDFLGVPDPGPDWVPDATMLHTMLREGRDNMGNPWPPELPRDFCAPMGKVEGLVVDNDKKLLEGVPLRGITPLPDGRGDGPKVFCGIYAMEENHAGNIRAMRETWAPHCDGFLVFSTRTDPRIPALAIQHEGPESISNMWQKVQSIWRYIGAHYLDDFDYFMLGQDDTLIIPENLRAYLKGLNQSPDADLFAGRRFHSGQGDNYFNDGGAGYVLSRGTLQKLYQKGLDHVDCNLHEHAVQADVKIAECLRKVFQIGLIDTRDSQGRERFHPFSPGQHLTWELPKPGTYDWYEDYNTEWGLKTGFECCAPDSVSFHYIQKPAAVRHLWSLLYQCQE